MGLYDVVDVGINLDDLDTSVSEEKEKVKLRIDEACIKCKNEFGRVDLEWIADKAGVSEQMVIVTLRGSAIYQNPEVFLDLDEWDASIGWLFAEQYLCGNITDKLLIAQVVEKRFPKCFDTNIAALQRIVPKKVQFSSIHASLGASWIPEDIYEDFLYDLFDVRGTIKVIYAKELNVWKIVASSSIWESNANLFLYGTSRMDAINIIQKTMNAASIKVYDYSSRHSFYDQKEFNKKETLAAQEKQILILRKWSEWLASHPAVKRKIEEFYNDQFVGYAFSPFDGSFLTFPDLNPDIVLYKHQKDTIARGLLSENNLLICHEVGSGKTYQLVALAHERKRMGLSKKILMIFPNNMLGDAVNAHKLLYPNDKILAIFPTDFTPKKRNEALENIKYGDYVAIYMAYSSFDMLTMSKNWWINEKSSKIQRLKTAIANSSDSVERRMLKSKVGALKKSLEKYMLNADEKPWMSFDSLGIDAIFIDEIHNFKNVSIESRSDNIVGMHARGSKRCDEALAKCSSVDMVVGATGTPLTNSLSDLYVLQQYLQANQLEYLGFNSFDSWIQTFAEREQQFEVDIDGNSLRLMTRFSKFHNLVELMSLFSSVCDFHFNTENELLPKWNGYIDIVCEKNPIQEKYISSLIERADTVRAHKVPRTEDNLLKICTDGRKAALDDRLVVEDAIDYYYTSRKVAKCAETVKEYYDMYPDTAQVIFSDIGTPKQEFNIYDALREELEILGVPSCEIAYVHDAATEKKREKLFKDVNAGKIRVIIGSTSKLGIAVNIQQKLIGLHHISVPWRVSDITQREGRIIRAYNTCEEVFIFRYITPGSLDSFSWQLLENKQKFISSFLSGTSKQRDSDDIGDAILNYAEIKAACIGNPLVKRRVEVANKIERTKILSVQKQSQLMDAVALIGETPERLNGLLDRREIIRKDAKSYKSKKDKIPNDERIAFGEELLEALADNNIVDKERVFAEYQGFSIVLPANMLVEKPYIYIKSKFGGVYYNDMTDVTTPLGCSKSIDYVLDHLYDRVSKLTDEIHNLKKNCEMARKDYEMGNPYEEELDKLYKELELIDEELERESEDAA